MDESYWDERYSGTDLVWTSDANRFVVQECADLRRVRRVAVRKVGEAEGKCRLAEKARRRRRGNQHYSTHHVVLLVRHLNGDSAAILSADDIHHPKPEFGDDLQQGVRLGGGVACAL